MKKACLTCSYWTKDPRHKNLKCYAGNCPAKKRDEESGWVKPGKVYYKPKVITIQIPYCPKCHKPISEVTDVDAKTIMTYHCDNCHYSQ